MTTEEERLFPRSYPDESADFYRGYDKCYEDIKYAMLSGKFLIDGTSVKDAIREEMVREGWRPPAGDKNG